jgi:predicted nucleic acid-binding protein
MPETVFWDTSAFVAVGNADDDLHRQAVQVSDALAQQKARILTTSAVLTEVANTFSRSGWRPVAHRLVESVHQSEAMGVAKVVHVDEALGAGLGTVRGKTRQTLGPDGLYQFRRNARSVYHSSICL